MAFSVNINSPLFKILAIGAIAPTVWLLPRAFKQLPPWVNALGSAVAVCSLLTLNRELRLLTHQESRQRRLLLAAEEIFDAELAHEISLSEHQYYLPESPQRLIPSLQQGESPTAGDMPVATISSPFDWSTITKRPHLFVLGDTGSGKTSLVQWLLANHYPKGSEVLVLDPHDRKGQWGNYPTVGRGRNFPAIELALENLVKEMDDRYSTGEYNRSPQIVVIEEMPAIADHCKTATRYIATLTLEARKVGIFLIVLSQGWEVESIGIKGKGSIRKSFLFISLGEFALDKAKQLDINLLQKVKECDRPCLVGDELAIIPDFASPQTKPNLSDLRQQLEFCLDATAPTKRQFTPTPKPALTSPLKEIFEYAKTQETVKARDIQNNVTGCKKIPPDEIREYFHQLEEMEYGYTDGEGSQLSFSPY